MAGTPQLIHVSDWELSSVPHREFDFLVEIKGRKEPRLEFPQHVESRWLGPDDLDVLAENRDLDEGLVRRLVELALRSRGPELAYASSSPSPGSTWPPTMSQHPGRKLLSQPRR
jgi:hypothetical protein